MKYILILTLALTILSCKREHVEQAKRTASPTVEDGGKKITLPDDPSQLKFFLTEKAGSSNVKAAYKAPASIQASVVSSAENGGRYTVLFDDPGLNGAYSQFIEHVINIKQYKINLERVKDLATHGVATGREVLDAETQLANEEAAVTEQEGALHLAGLDASQLKEPKSKQVWIIGEVPESQIAQITKGTPCRVTFTAFANESFNANVDGVGSEVDRVTRMVKVRVVLSNNANRFTVGMFANILFNLSESKSISIPSSAVVSVQGKDYVFIKTSATTFERREVLVGQQMDDRIIILHGLETGDEVVAKGAMEMKGLSFGY